MGNNFDEYFVEEKTSTDRLLDFLVFIAVFAVTIFLILELFASAGKFDMAKVESIYFYVNIVVFCIFIADLIRLWQHAHGAKDFFKKNWLDVLATIPFGLMASLANYKVLNALKWARAGKLASVSKVSKISRVSKIGKEFKAASHLKKEGEDYKRKHRL